MLQNLVKHNWPPPIRKQGPTVQTITAAELHQCLSQKESLLLVDVRSPEEYHQEGHIAGARLLPLPALLQRSRELPKDRPIVFVCRSGNRSGIACEQLISRGFANVLSLTGGMIAWHQAGLRPDNWS